MSDSLISTNNPYRVYTSYHITSKGIFLIMNKYPTKMHVHPNSFGKIKDIKANSIILMLNRKAIETK